MIDSLIETVKQAEQKAGWMPPLVPESNPDRLARYHQAWLDLTHDGKQVVESRFIGKLSCYVSDAVWDYCLQEALKPID